MQKTSLRRSVAMTTGIAFGVLGLSGCTNFSGNGNEFEVVGEVLRSGEQSLTINVDNIKFAQGKATTWFNDYDKHQIHDNCNCDSNFLNSNIDVGTVYDESGQIIEPSDVAIGSCVNIVGKIRSNKQGKSEVYRPVFDTAHTVPCDITP